MANSRGMHPFRQLSQRDVIRMVTRRIQLRLEDALDISHAHLETYSDFAAAMEILEDEIGDIIANIRVIAYQPIEQHRKPLQPEL